MRLFGIALIIVAFFATAYLAPGLIYWWNQPTNVAYCLYQNAECATAVFTFFLTLFTGMAFIVAIAVAIYAYRTFQLERTAILGVRRCKETGHPVAIDIMLTPTGVELKEPTDEEASYYYEMAYEFISLGRIPVVEARADLRFQFSGRISGQDAGERRDKTIPLGNFKADGNAHVRLWIAPESLDTATITWIRESARHRLDNRDVRLEFHPLATERPEYRCLVTYDREPDVAVRPAPAPVPVPTKTELHE